MNVMTAIEELLFIVAACVLFSLKFSSLLPDFFCGGKTFERLLPEKKCRCTF